MERLSRHSVSTAALRFASCACSQALEYFTFTMVAEPVIRLVHGIEEAGMGQKLHRRPSPRHVVSGRCVNSFASSNSECSAPHIPPRSPPFQLTRAV